MNLIKFGFKMEPDSVSVHQNLTNSSQERMGERGDKPIVFKKMSPFQSFTKNPPDVSHCDLKSQSLVPFFSVFFAKPKKNRVAVPMPAC